MIVQLCKFAKNNLTLPLKQVNFISCKLYLIKAAAVFWRKEFSVQSSLRNILYPASWRFTISINILKTKKTYGKEIYVIF